MGYKTIDVNEKEKLEKEGHKVIACKGIPYSGPEYEFDFDITDKNIDIVPEIITEPEEPIEPVNAPVKAKRGNPKWIKGRKR